MQRLRDSPLLQIHQLKPWTTCYVVLAFQHNGLLRQKGGPFRKKKKDRRLQFKLTLIKGYR